MNAEAAPKRRNRAGRHVETPTRQASRRITRRHACVVRHARHRRPELIRVATIRRLGTVATCFMYYWHEPLVCSQTGCTIICRYTTADSEEAESREGTVLLDP